MSDDLTMQAVHCSNCGKRVSQYVTVQGEPAPLLVRAWVECPECVQAEFDSYKGPPAGLRKPTVLQPEPPKGNNP